jgi:hypothetical protein
MQMPIGRMLDVNFRLERRDRSDPFIDLVRCETGSQIRLRALSMAFAMSWKILLGEHHVF